MTIWIGLTGGIGSGKSQVAAIFAGFNVPIIDTDAISRSLTAENGQALPAIYDAFGAEVFETPKRLNRAVLRECIFNNACLKTRLEQIMLPLIRSYSRQMMNQYQQAAFGIIEVPLLIEKKAFQKLVHRILVVDSAESLRIERVKQRSGLDEPEIKRIMANQASHSERWRAADDILLNDGSLQELQAKVGRLHRYYTAVFRPNH